MKIRTDPCYDMKARTTIFFSYQLVLLLGGFALVAMPPMVRATDIMPASGNGGRLSRFEAGLDDGTTVTVDNASSWPDKRVASLVLAADRSTQQDRPHDGRNYKGLFKSGDRIFVNSHYLAWFDYTRGDGITFANPPYNNAWERSGALAGWWTLDPATAGFRYPKTGPNGGSNWAHNELIPGSASPRREQHWWDAYSPPVEHSMVVVSATNSFFLSYHYAKQTTNSHFTILLDGYADTNGLHYKTSARMTSWTYNVDVADGNDTDGISNYIQAEVEYVCRPEDILCTWKWKPNNADVVVNNLFTALWIAYAQNEDRTPCDPAPGGSHWPHTVYGQPLYNQSSHPLQTCWPPGASYPAGAIVAMLLGLTCSDPHVNQDIQTLPPFALTNGSWLRCGEDAHLSIDKPRWQFTRLGTPNSGSGTQSDPCVFIFEKLVSWNETHDGTLGFSLNRGPYPDPAKHIRLRAGTWYRADWSIRTDF
jgi:hypothetical protein